MPPLRSREGKGTCRFSTTTVADVRHLPSPQGTLYIYSLHEYLQLPLRPAEQHTCFIDGETEALAQACQLLLTSTAWRLREHAVGAPLPPGHGPRPYSWVPSGQGQTAGSACGGGRGSRAPGSDPEGSGLPTGGRLCQSRESRLNLCPKASVPSPALFLESNRKEQRGRRGSPHRHVRTPRRRDRAHRPRLT